MGKNKKKKKKKKNKTLQDPLDTTMSLGDHLEELRGRLIKALLGLAIGVVIGLIFCPKIIGFMQKPYIDVMGPEAILIVLGPADGILSYIKISLISGLLLTCPWVFYQIWMFVAAGLYPHEKRYVHIATPFSAGLFVIGALFFLMVVAPLTLDFLVGFNERSWDEEKKLTY